jgi:peptidoglycan/xylan/chitin deacetylase (PgdA/CDA1 family)
VARRLPPLALAYHGVNDVPLRSDPHGLFVRPEDLRRHIAVLRAWGYRLVTFSELAEHAAARSAVGYAALTFDDGFGDNLEQLVPLLRAEGAAATVFAVSGWLGRPHPDAPHARLMSGPELRELHAAGVEVGGHTAGHPDLTTLGENAARKELEEGRRELERVIGSPVSVAAYPFGRANEAVRRACRSAGFRAACRTSTNGGWEDPFDLPREDMENRSSSLSLHLKRLGYYEPLMATLPGRAARRARRRLLARLG